MLFVRPALVMGLCVRVSGVAFTILLGLGWLEVLHPKHEIYTAAKSWAVLGRRNDYTLIEDLSPGREGERRYYVGYCNS